ncbi:hypothetical protein HIO71_13210 [Chryseobacterium aquaticum]|uniref:DUF5977 domain-containing protein n=1 Tax=Chryseobacterium aquaticum TaxID=452084 RepID=A0A848N8T7_9FLAO|nr:MULTISPECIES: DUF5977 domain-containing protein [Chryseobacterium]NMR35148.1 hypothetical protein [Chryseobacterium aquaticum]NRQ47415.1 hypothetical protein [Chryseobacterium sp. C-204]
MMKKINLCLFLYISTNIFYGQKSTELDFKTPMPPESYQFKKRLVNNVSLFTGQPSVSIPIYTIDLDGMDIPITVSYNTGGIKTDEEATFVGLGWSLNIGGEINRTNHGALDENYLMTTPYNLHSNGSAGIGFLKELPTINNNSPLPIGGFDQYCTAGILTQTQDYINFYKNAYFASDPLAPYESIDARPDEFFYSMPNHSGKLMFSQKNSRFVTMPFDDIRTQYNISSTQYGTHIKKNLDFIFTLSNGFKVNFGREGIKSMYKLMTGGRLFDQTWQIGSVISPKGNSVNYSYQPIEYNLCTNLYPISTAVEDIITNQVAKCNEVVNKDNIPSQIIFPNGKIIFNYEDRIDLMAGAKKLKNIIVYDIAGVQIKKIEFDHSYFEANFDSFSGNLNATNLNAANKRLRLNSVKMIYGSNDNFNSNEVYAFDYYLFDKIPSKTTKSRDHWGYFNGGVFGSYNNVYDFNPKYKNIHNWYSQVFSLKSIQYPEGGKKEFVYEPHQAIPHERIEKYFDEISDDRYSIKENKLVVSGYSLNNFYPVISDIQLPNHAIGHKVLLGEEFEIKDVDVSLSKNEKSIYITSDLTLMHPDYQNINREYNYVAFELQKKIGSSYQYFSTIGEISKQSNSNGVIQGDLKINSNESGSLTQGFYRVVMIINQPLANQYSSTINHNTNISLKFRRKIKDDARIGGLRIKKINTYLQGNVTPNYATEYMYNNDQEKSSGKIVSVPDYKEIVHLRNPQQTGSSNLDIVNKHKLAIKTSTDPVLPLYKASGSNVGYTKITKRDINYLTNEEIKESSYYTFQDSYFSDIPSSSLSRNQEPKTWQRGKILKNQYFRNNQIIKEESFEYNGEAIEFEMDEVDEINTDLVSLPEFTCDFEPMQSKHIDLYNNTLNFNWTPTSQVLWNLYNPTGHLGSTFIPYFKIYSGFDRIKSKTITDFNNGIPTLTKKENFYYNNNIYKQLEKQNVILPDNKTVETKYKYASDLNDTNMIDAYMIGLPLETETKNNGNTIAKSKIIYSKNNNTSSFVLPTSVLNYDLNNIVVSAENVKYDLYDSRGNLMQYSISSQGDIIMPTTIIWGYDKRQPIAKIEGARYDQVESYLAEIISASDKDLNPAYYNLTPIVTEENLLSKLNEFRKKPELNNFKVSTYTYDPLIGIRSITPPSGITEFYSYDTSNRLQSIKDMSGNILKDFNYNLKGFTSNSNTNGITYLNQMYSSSFQRNNCAPNFVGGYYVYKVNEGIFISNISQADANQKALDEITANGQNVANNSATCVPAVDVSCIFTPTSNYFINHYNSSFLYKPAINSVNAQYIFALPYFTTSLDWSQGVYIGSIASSCAPTTNRTVVINNGSNTWNVIINTSGQLTLKLVSGTIVYSSTPTTFNFQYQK